MSILSLRSVSAVLLSSAAAASLIMAVQPLPVKTSESAEAPRIEKFRRDLDDVRSNKWTLPGPDNDLGPLNAAVEDAMNRAYPATEVPIQFTLNAQNTYKQIRSRGTPKKNIGSWSLVGPSAASDPAILTFSGQDYVTSGRITAMAISPNCTQGGCRMWVAAAGFGGRIRRFTPTRRSNGISFLAASRPMRLAL